MIDLKLCRYLYDVQINFELRDDYSLVEICRCGQNGKMIYEDDDVPKWCKYYLEHIL